MKEISINVAELPYRYQLQLAGITCNVATNCNVLQHTLRTWSVSESNQPASFSMQVLVSAEVDTYNDRPHFRGLQHLVIASFGPANIFVFDLARRLVSATVSLQLANDQSFWDRLLLPIALGVLGATVGVVPVHCACLSIDVQGLLIAGASGAGKSTLAVALAQNGFDYISDDWTYFSLEGTSLVAHGMSVPAKLLPDAVDHFPSLAAYPIRMALNQELAYELPPQDLDAAVRLACEPRWFLFLERIVEEGCRFDPISPDEAFDYIEGGVERLPPELGEAIHIRSAIIGEISQLSCWKFKYGGPPQIAVRGVHEFIVRQREKIPA
jgi:hypothetical protein